ncbi:hypothetical protein EHI_014140 [Entamoeba histolytica HM-1:IMSS]|uniref:DUF2428 domain-containing protein n=1 Tax=Entamoeba histolytica (strain ATCC 30459 / HM-1:IMSS / ABRM) TaxID=294381 RepID=C4LXQ2_ENTH1|nr:hypothetical protein EHI_014140 [Entamoeba histolytica HM-1:IMSS]EAL49669.2 hypothetical protein EHI_014140 [Entamoeba histolytica HM-1:IMSS]|eukprot:XP_655057.2 hypothetical protein EHI_014140 [Entamoeba histolytica HM-1:IMSS]
MNNIIDKHLHFNLPKTPEAILSWVQSSEKSSKELLSYLNKKNSCISNEQLEKLEQSIRQIIQLPLSKPAYNAYGHIIYLILIKLNKEITNEPFVLRASLSDKKEIINEKEMKNIILCIKKRSFDVISSVIESLNRYIKKQGNLSQSIRDNLDELIQLIRNELVLTQDNKEWVLLKEGYFGLVKFLNEEQSKKELISSTLISWNCKGKYVILDALSSNTNTIITSIVPQLLFNVIKAVEETTYKTVALNLLSHLLKECIISFEDAINQLKQYNQFNESTMKIMNILISLKPSNNQIQLAANQLPLVTAAALKMNSYDMNSIISFIPSIEKELNISLQNALNKSFHLSIVTTLYSDLTRINYHQIEVNASKDIIKGLYDCPTDEIQVITTMIPKFILRCSIEVIQELFNFICTFIAHPFNEKIDCSIIQICINIIQNNKRNDIKQIISHFLSTEEIQLLFKRSILSRTDKLRTIAFSLYSLLNLFTKIHYQYLQTQLQKCWIKIKSLRTSEADAVARIFSILCSFKPYPIVTSNNTIQFTGSSLEDSIHSVIIQLKNSIDKILPSKCVSYEDDCVYGLFRILQLLHKEKDGFTLAIQLIDSSDYLLTLPAPEGSAPGMVVGGWTSVRVASEIIASQSSLDFTQASQRLVHILRTALHRGIFERAAGALEIALPYASNEWLSEQVNKVVNEIGYETKFTRRSAGLPYHLSALLNEECRRIKQPTMAPPLLEYVINTLTHCDRNCAIHSMNTLAGLIKSQKIAAEIDLFFPGKALNYSFKYIDDIDWSLRNSASILSATVIKRIFATQENFTLNHLLFLIPNSISEFSSALENGLNSAMIVCMILSRLSSTNLINKSSLQQSLVKSLLIASHRKLFASSIDALAIAFTKCTLLEDIPELFNSLNATILRIVKEYVDNGSVLSSDQISHLISFKPLNSFEAYQYLNVLQSLNIKLPQLHQFHYSFNDAYTLKCIKLIARYHANDSNQLPQLLTSDQIIVREAALLRCEESPKGVDPQQFFESTFTLLFKEAPHVFHVLKAMISVIDYNQNIPINQYIKNTPQLINQLHTFIEKEPLLHSLSTSILLRLNCIDYSQIDSISLNEHEMQYYFKHFPINQSIVSIISLLLEDIEKGICITNAFNNAFLTSYDPYHLLYYLLSLFVSSYSDNCNKTSMTELCNVLFNPSIFNYLNEITHTTQIFEPELPSFNYDRIELIKYLSSNLSTSKELSTYIKEIKKESFIIKDSVEIVNQLTKTFQKELN